MIHWCRCPPFGRIQHQQESSTNQPLVEKYPYICRIWMFPKIVVPPKSSIFNRVFHYRLHPFWGTRIFGNTRICIHLCLLQLIFIFSPSASHFHHFPLRLSRLRLHCTVNSVALLLAGGCSVERCEAASS